MTPRQWSKSFETGQPVIDGQHIELFDLLDEIEDLMAGGDGDKTVARCKAFRTLLDKHSADEEDILRQAEFPELRRHMDEHIQIMGRMKKIFGGCGEACRTKKSNSCLGDISYHMLDHVIRLDLGFKSHLQMKKLAPDR